VITEEQYLEIERKAERKSEYFQGEMFAMAGANVSHGRINFNLVALLSRQLSGSDCEVLFSDLRVKVPATGLYAYPDVLVVCGELEFSDKHRDTITNPNVIIEILSPSTEFYDRGSKFVSYRSIPSFREYLLVAQNRTFAEHYMKQRDGGWLLHETSSGEESISLDSIGVKFALKEAYARVQF